MGTDVPDNRPIPGHAPRPLLGYDIAIRWKRPFPARLSTVVTTPGQQKRFEVTAPDGEGIGGRSPPGRKPLVLPGSPGGRYVRGACQGSTRALLPHHAFVVVDDVPQPGRVRFGSDRTGKLHPAGAAAGGESAVPFIEGTRVHLGSTCVLVGCEREHQHMPTVGNHHDIVGKVPSGHLRGVQRGPPRGARSRFPIRSSLIPALPAYQIGGAGRDGESVSASRTSSFTLTQQ